MKIRSIIMNLLTVMGLGLVSEIAHGAQGNARNVVMLLDAQAESVLGFYGGFLLQKIHAALDYGKCPIVVSAPILHAWLTHASQFEHGQDKDLFLKLIQDTQEQYGLNLRDRNAMLAKRKLAADLIKRNSSLDMEIYRLDMDASEAERKLYRDASTLKANLGTSDYIEKSDKINAATKIEADSLKTKRDKAKELLIAEQQRIKKERNALESEYLFQDLIDKNPQILQQYECFIRQARLNGYVIYKCANTHEYLMIPKSLEANEIATGFNVANKQILIPLTVAQLKSDLQSWNGSSLTQSAWKLGRALGSLMDSVRFAVLWTLRNKVNWQELKKIFVPQSEGWVFYISGHGMYTAPRVQQRARLCPIKKEYLTDMHNFATGFAHNCGLTITDHQDMLGFLGTTIKSEKVYQATCFGGGYHNREAIKRLQVLANDKQFKPYVFINGATTDATVFGASMPECYKFSEFFEHVRGSNDIKSTDEKARKEEGFKKGLKAITPNELLSALGTPTCFMPGAQEAFAIDVHDSVHIINDNDAADASVKEKEGILLYPSNFTHTISIGTNLKSNFAGDTVCPMIISMKVGDAVHHIQRLKADVPFNELLATAFYGFWETSKKVFVLGHVEAKEYEDSGFQATCDTVKLEDVIIVKDKHAKAYGFFTVDRKVIGKVYGKFADKEQFFVAHVDGSYDSEEPAIIGKFMPIAKTEYLKVHNLYSK